MPLQAFWHPTSSSPPIPVPSRHNNPTVRPLLQDAAAEEARSGGKKTNIKKKNNAKKKKKLGSTKTQGDKPVLWVDLFRCFLCGKEGRSPPLQKCSQCEVAYYCGKICQQAH